MSFKHNWIFYALSVLVATLAAFESVRLLFILLLISGFLTYKKIAIGHVVGVLIVGTISYFSFIHEIKRLNEPLQLPEVLTWTDEYTIKGNVLRGFMKDRKGRTIYVKYEIKSENEKINFQQTPLVGMEFRVDGKLVEPSKPNHDYAFDMKRYLKSKGAIGIVEISEWQFIGIQDSISRKISLQRFHLKQHIEETFPHSLVGEAQALLIGLQENVDEETSRAYQTLGITHLFAISGLHIAIVSFIFFQGLLRLKVRRELATIVLMIVLPIYGILAGGAPSVWRAITIVEIMMISRIKGNKLSVDDCLAISFILFVWLEPWVIYQVGFQLSYLATASLIYSGPLINRFSSWIIQSFFITFVCQLLVYPLLLFHFYEISLSSFIVNIFFVPLFSFIILPINIVLLFVSYFPFNLSSFLFHGYEPVRLFLTTIIDFLQSIPHQMWNPGKPTIILILVAFISVFIVFYLLDSQRNWSIILIVLFIPALIIHFSGKLSNELKISFINVGQGDCVVIELPYRKQVYMIDTGGLLRFEQEQWKKSNRSYEIGRDVVVPYLKGKGITKIDKLILTHADSDHVEGAEEVLQEIEVKEIHITPSSYKEKVMNELLMEAESRKIPIIEQISNRSWKVDDITFTYLWPKETTYEGNNDSLVLYMSMNQFDALFTGDLEKEGEQIIVKEYPDLSKIDVLKAGHHGSKTSSSEEFIGKLQPSLTIFSAGENNRYGHPHQEVVERFDAYDLTTLTTSEVGTIEVTISDSNMEIVTSNKEKREISK
ncbi:DNA internalization-related competence protein ComEC/Rec2 [Lysinibacillus halotolerans]|uniref:DNA internalization-related competence protein ComEC/Rec2 n=1 Tax=Lysinibacillus halotolerans TaxID=1368476 RepID=A0A3M8HCD2_9BACI|nr:DNA internalization-related competence protein ComEC/Rec2 [Lysinibacillus halotolerans]RND00042.1 DNA internalization-related competence protein ComEC/Rec2 [Lysinibacillus halotolerans]